MVVERFVMGKVGLVAGKGKLPLEFVRSAKAAGDSVVVFAINGMASPQLEEETDNIYWLNVGQFGKFIFLLLKEKIRQLAFIGKVEKSTIYDEDAHDDEARRTLKSAQDKKDYSILEVITRRLGRFGIEVIDGRRYLSCLLPEKGVLSRRVPDARVKEDIGFGFNIAKKLAGMDIGQTVVVKDKAVVAVEAMEGTDATIERASSIAGTGCVMIKVSRPNQDMRWDIPTVGPETMTRLSENKFSALAVENNKMFMVEKEKLIRIADDNNIVVECL